MKKIIYTFAARGWSALAAFLFSIVIARLLEPEAAGAYFTGLTIAAGLAIVIRFGFDNYIIRKNADGGADKFSNLIAMSSASLIVFLLLALAVFAAVSLFDGLVEPGAVSQAMPYFVGASLFFAMLWLAAGFLKSIGRAPLANFIEAGLMPTGLVLIYSIFFGSVTLINAAQIYLGAAVCLALLVYSYIAIKYGTGYCLKGFPAWSDVKESSGIMISGVLDFAVLWFSALVLMNYVSMAEVAEFQIAQRLAVLISFILIVINSISAPVFARLFRSNEIDEVGRALRLSSTLMTLIAMFPLGLFWLFPEVLLDLYGEEYHGAASLLVILSIGQLVNVMCGSVGYVMMMSGRSHIYKRNTLASALVAVALSLALIPAYGALGAAVASTAGLAVKNILGAVFVKRIFGLNALPSYRHLVRILTLKEDYEVFTYRH